MPIKSALASSLTGGLRTQSTYHSVLNFSDARVYPHHILSAPSENNPPEVTQTLCTKAVTEGELYTTQTTNVGIITHTNLFKLHTHRSVDLKTPQSSYYTKRQSSNQSRQMSPVTAKGDNARLLHPILLPDSLPTIVLHPRGRFMV